MVVGLSTHHSGAKGTSGWGRGLICLSGTGLRIFYHFGLPKWSKIGQNRSKMVQNGSKSDKIDPKCTMVKKTSLVCLSSLCEIIGESVETSSYWGSLLAIICLEPGMPCRHNSANCIEYVPAVCTHRPSLQSIGSMLEVFQR